MDPSYSVDSDDAHHLRHVLRLRKNGALRHCGGRKRAIFDPVASTADERWIDPKLKLGRRHQADRPKTLSPARPSVGATSWLIDGPDRDAFYRHLRSRSRFALVKGDRNDWAIQKLTELGVDRIQPLLTDRSVLRLDGPDRQRRGASVSVASPKRPPRKPDGRRLPKFVEDPIDFACAVAALPERAAIAEPGGGEFAPGVTTVFVGPEGGWSDQELAAGLAHGRSRANRAAGRNRRDRGRRSHGRPA